jgi:hypothetical protein
VRTSIIAVALLLIAGSASATLVAVGDPFDTGSWSQAFKESGVSFDHIQLQMATSDLFESPGISNFSSAGWQGGMSGDSLLLWADAAEGTSVSLLQFDVRFLGDTTDSFMFHFQAYMGSTLVENVDTYWNTEGYPGFGTLWAYRAGTGGDYGPVPEPISMVMLGCVGAGMLVARKLRGKRAT